MINMVSAPKVYYIFRGWAQTEALCDYCARF